ncbi:tripartite tricarboxylate transporter substrate binding protein [Limnohabitans sp. Rim8]|uniref:tripartite tricarboxylate transporter substrate binding protein n=2 Tax=Limnohabitans sp. Rim8 TaxID=1100718 RepID=UPI0033060903
MKRQLFLGALSIFLGGAMVWHLPANAQADSWPAKKPIRLIVHFAPGGVLDIITRALSGPLAQELGQSVVVENKAGAGGNIGTDFVARAAPDGYTALMYSDPNTIAPALYSKLNHDPLRDFDPVTMLAVGSHVLVAHQSAPVRSLAELIDYAKKNPGKLSYATPGNGTAQHLGGETFKAMAGLDIAHLPYKGGGQAIVDVVSGQVPLGMLGFAPALPHIRSGRLTALAVTGEQRIALLPDVPTMQELGLKMVTLQWVGISLPRGTPREIVERLHHATVRASRDEQFISRVEAIGMSVKISHKTSDFAEFIRQDIARWPAMVRTAGAKVD